jgi:biopolymer transport protein ExbB
MVRGRAGILTISSLLASQACGRIGYEPTPGAAIDAAPAFADASQDWWDEAWLGRTELRVDNSGIDEDLINFPLLLHLTPAVFDYAQARADGGDIRFVAGDGVTELAHEIESFVSGGDSFIWVKVPLVAANSDQTRLWLYFSNATPAAAPPAEEVWADFHAVYHLSDASSDSTGNHPGNPGDGDPTQVPTNAVGQIGKAQDFDGVDDIITVSPSDSFNFTQPGLTMGAWVELDDLRPDWNNFLGINGYGSGYRMGIHGVDGRSGFQCPGETHTMNSPTLVIPPGWHYIVATWDGEFMRHYFDGVEDSVPLEKTNGIVPGTSPFFIGIAQYPFRGAIDEVRVANIARSDAWLRASYRSMKGEMLIFD